MVCFVQCEMLQTAGKGLFQFIESVTRHLISANRSMPFFFARPSKTFWYFAKVRTTNASAHWMQCNDGSDEEGLLTTLFSLHLPSAQCPRCQIGCSCKRQCQIRVRFESRGRQLSQQSSYLWRLSISGLRNAPMLSIWKNEQVIFLSSLSTAGTKCKVKQYNSHDTPNFDVLNQN